MKKRPKGRPRKKKAELRVRLDIRVSVKSKKTVERWGKDKAKRLDEAIEMRDAKEG